MPSRVTRSRQSASVAALAAARRKSTGGAAADKPPRDVASLDYAIAHPAERVVVQGPRYSVVMPGIAASKLADADLKRLLRVIAYRNTDAVE